MYTFADHVNEYLYICYVQIYIYFHMQMHTRINTYMYLGVCVSE